MSSIYNASGATASLIIDGRGGDDRITINGNAALFAGGIAVIGGDNGDGSDR